MSKVGVGLMFGTIAVSGVFSGCIVELFCGDTRTWNFGWTQPGAYEAFPPPGNESGYYIRYDNFTYGLIKTAEKETEDQVHLGLAVGEGDGARFRVSGHFAGRSPSQDEMRSWLRQTLEDLELGELAYSGTPEFEKELPAC